MMLTSHNGIRLIGFADNNRRHADLTRSVKGWRIAAVINSFGWRYAGQYTQWLDSRQSAGPTMDEKERQTVTAELKAICQERQREMWQNYLLIREAYSIEYDFPELDPVRHEVALCLVFGLPQAAITLTNHLLESLLKYALIYDHALKHQPNIQPQPGAATRTLVDWLRPAKHLYADKDLNFTIDRACAVGLITKAQKKRFHEIRQNFRNAFSHADKDKTFHDTIAQVTPTHVKGGTISTESPEQVPIADLLIGQGFFQVTYAQKSAVPYFLYIDRLAREIRAKVFLGGSHGD